MMRTAPSKDATSQSPLRLSGDTWENLCDGCGYCCAFGGTNIACPSFDHDTNRCKVYEKRLDVELCCEKVSPESVPRLHKAGILPDSCGYVRFMLGKPPLENPPVAKLVPFILMRADEQTRYVRAREAWREARGLC